MTTIGIVGAGAAGLATAYGLRTAPVDVTVFEKSRGFGGRAATRGRDGHRYDHGATFFSSPTERVHRLVTRHLSSEGLVDIGSLAIWGFERDGTLVQNEPDGKASPRWTYRAGVSTLGKLLARQSKVAVRRNTRITGLAHQEKGWSVQTADGAVEKMYDALVLTPPAPQTATLLETASMQSDSEAVNAVWQAVRDVRYASQFAYIFAYNHQLDRPDNLCGLRGVDDQHPLAWIGFENAKPGHVREGHSVVIVHTSPSWTAERVDARPSSFVADVQTWMNDLLDADLQDPAWVDTQRWRYSRPKGQVASAGRAAGREVGLFLAGDAVAGRGGVGAALENGLATADRLRKWG